MKPNRTTYPLPDGSVAEVTMTTFPSDDRIVRRKVNGKQVWKTTLPRTDVDALVVKMIAEPERYVARRGRKYRQLPIHAGECWMEPLGDLLARPEPPSSFDVMLAHTNSKGEWRESWMNLGWLMRPDRERARGEASLTQVPSSLVLVVRDADQ